VPQAHLSVPQTTIPLTRKKYAERMIAPKFYGQEELKHNSSPRFLAPTMGSLMLSSASHTWRLLAGLGACMSTFARERALQAGRQVMNARRTKRFALKYNAVVGPIAAQAGQAVLRHCCESRAVHHAVGYPRHVLNAQLLLLRQLALVVRIDERRA
jgi:hypothetical protein